MLKTEAKQSLYMLFCFVLHQDSKEGASDTAQGNNIIFEAEDVGLGSVSSSSLHKCLWIAWSKRVGEEAAEEIFFERSGSSFVS